MMERNESKLIDLIDKALEVIRNRPTVQSIEAGDGLFKVYWDDKRPDGQHHALLRLHYDRRRADLGSRIRIWVNLNDVMILDFPGNRMVPIGSGVGNFCVEFDDTLTGEVSGITEVLEAAREALLKELERLEKMVSCHS